MKKLMLIAIIGLCGNAVFAQKSGKKLQVHADKPLTVEEAKEEKANAKVLEKSEVKSDLKTKKVLLKSEAIERKQASPKLLKD